MTESRLAAHMLENMHVVGSEHKVEKGKSLALRLKQEELAALNQLFKIDGFVNLSELVHSYLRGELSKSSNTVEVDRLLKRLRDRKITDPLTGQITPTFYKKHRS